MRTPDKMPTEHSFKLIEELQLNEPAEIAKTRSRDSVRVRAEVVVESGNASLRGAPAITGQARELTRDQLKLTAAVSLHVGDVYRARFDREALPLPDSYLLCTACRLLQDDCFEIELRFFSPIDLSRLPCGDSA